METIRVAIAADDMAFARALAKGLGEESRQMNFLLLTREREGEEPVSCRGEPAEEASVSCRGETAEEASVSRRGETAEEASVSCRGETAEEAPVSRRGEPAEEASVSCRGDGSSGNRDRSPCRREMWDLLLITGQTGDFPKMAGPPQGEAAGVVTLVKHREEENLWDGPPYRLYRFKEKSDLAKDLLLIYYQMTGRTASCKGEGKCRVVFFYLAQGGSGVTSLTLATAAMLRRIYGSRCLYLNLTPVNGSELYLGAKGRGGLRKLLYYLDRERDFPLDAFVHCGEDLDWIDEGTYNAAFDGVTPERMIRLMTLAEAEGRYDFLLVDLGNCLSPAHRQLMEAGGKSVRISHGGRIDAGRDGKYGESISREMGGEKMDSLHVMNFAGDLWQAPSSAPGASSPDVFIGSQAEAFNPGEDGLVHLDLSGSYGMEVLEIGRRLMEQYD